MLFIHIVNYIYDNQHILIQRSVKNCKNFYKLRKKDKGDIRDVREYKKTFKRRNFNFNNG